LNRAACAAAALALAVLLGPPAGSPSARAAGPIPTIVSVDPAVGLVSGGISVTITGTDFSEPMDVTFGGIPANSVVVANATTLTCIAPPHARGFVDVIVVQSTPPPSASAPLVAGFEYREVPSFAWVPRAPGSETGGNPGGLDVTVVDWANREVAGSLDLNAADADLPTDDAWAVSQVLFDATGAHAFLATRGTPGSLDSQKVFVVRTARVLGTEAGDPILSRIDTDGNPYQVALSADGNFLFVADGGSWKGSASVLPNGTFRAYNVADRAAPALLGTATAVGILPVLAYDRASWGGWGTNSSFTGILQSKEGRTVVTNAGSHTLSVIDVGTRRVDETEDVGFPDGGVVQLSTSIPSPFNDDFLFVQTLDVLAGDTRYFAYRISDEAVLDKGTTTVPVQFFPVVPAPDLASRGAWPHPDGQSLVAIPAADASVASWSPSSGSAANRTAIPGGGPPTTLAYNDVTKRFYAREADGGWTVFSVPSDRGAAPVQVTQVPEATGVDSLRVVGDGTFLVGTAASTLAVVDGGDSGTTAHSVVESVALPLDPAGGPSFPQPGPGGAPARTFVTLPGVGAGPRITDPSLDLQFGPASAVPLFEFEDPAVPPAPAADDAVHELEIATQPDFLALPGAPRLRARIAKGVRSVRPARSAWLRVLRAASGGLDRPFYARVNRLLPSGTRVFGVRLDLLVLAPEPPDLLDPFDGDEHLPDDPPTFEFTAPGAGRYWVEFAGDDGFAAEFLGRVAAGVGPDADGIGFPVPPDRWRRLAEAAIRRAPDATVPATILCRVRHRDRFGRSAFSDAISLEVAGVLDAPAPTGPDPGASAPPGSPPVFAFDFTGPGRYEVEFAGDGGFADEFIGSLVAAKDPAGSSATFTPPAGRWEEFALEAVRRTALPTSPARILWRVRVRDPFGRSVASASRDLLVAAGLVLPTQTAPDDGAEFPPDSPPTFAFTANGAGRYAVEIAGPGGFPADFRRAFAAGTVASGTVVLVPIPARAWRNLATAAGGEAFWRVRFEDALGRSAATAPLRLDLE
jgi:hypothetical protein